MRSREKDTYTVHPPAPPITRRLTVCVQLSQSFATKLAEIMATSSRSACAAHTNFACTEPNLSDSGGACGTQPRSLRACAAVPECRGPCSMKTRRAEVSSGQAVSSHCRCQSKLQSRSQLQLPRSLARSCTPTQCALSVGERQRQRARRKPAPRGATRRGGAAAGRGDGPGCARRFAAGSSPSSSSSEEQQGDGAPQRHAKQRGAPCPPSAAAGPATPAGGAAALPPGSTPGSIRAAAPLPA